MITSECFSCVLEVRRAECCSLFCTNDKTTRLVYDMHEETDELMLEGWEGPVNDLMDAEDQANSTEKYRFQSNTISVIELSLV